MFDDLPLNQKILQLTLLSEKRTVAMGNVWHAHSGFVGLAFVRPHLVSNSGNV